ncbi:MAG TPA: ATP-binding cassette domain-containing protein [Verrucomicrobiae bacterium]|nr:ATP-binding cassette domain-containing protein [Verrucomicrobiae bacterium]
MMAELNPQSPVIELEDAVIANERRPEVAALEMPEWRVAAGDFWVIGAPPGSGKTGLLATASGLLQPLRGKLRLFGEEIGPRDGTGQWEVRRRVGLVFEDGARLLSRLTIAENIGLPLLYHGEDDKDLLARIEDILRRTDLESVAREFPREVLRSSRQRAGLARAIALQPEVLLLDNPLAGLDPRQTRWWIDFLAEWRAKTAPSEGHAGTLVVTCEDMRPWLDQGTHFALLQNGRWRSLGNRDEVRASREEALADVMSGEFRPN